MTATAVDLTDGLLGYDNIIAARQTDLVIQNVSATPTAYQVFNEAGLFASGSWPSPSAITMREDQSTAISSSTTATASWTLATSPVVGDTIVICLGTTGGNPTSVVPSNGGVTSWQITPTIERFAGIICVGTVTTGGFKVVSVAVGPMGGGTNTLNATVILIGGCAEYGVVDQQSANGNNTGQTVSTIVGNASGQGGINLTPLTNGELVIACVEAQAAVGAPGGSPTLTDFASVTSGMKTSGFDCGYYQNSPSTATAMGGAGWTTPNGNLAAVSLNPLSGGTTLTIPAPGGGTWPPGYYYVVILNGSTVVDSVQVMMARTVFGVGLPRTSQLPAYGTAGSPADPSSSGNDLYLHGFLAMGPLRYQITSGTAPTLFSVTGFDGGFGGNIANIETNIAEEQGASWYLNPSYSDPARPRHAFVAFPNDRIVQSGALYTGTTTTEGTSGGYSNAPTYKAGVTSVVSALSSLYGVLYYEGINEPTNSGLSSNTDSALQYYNFRVAVRAGNASALAMGPAAVSAFPTHAQFGPTTGDILSFTSAVTTDGGSVDVYSVHGYNQWNGDYFAVENWLSKLTALTGGKPIWVTEAGNVRYNFAGNLNLAEPLREVAWFAHFFQACEEYGIPKEQISIFYDTAHGFDWASWVKEKDNSLRPVATFIRVWSEELWSKTYAGGLTLGSATAATFYRATVFTDPSDVAGTCLVLCAPGMVSDTAVISGSGIGAGPITYSNWAGITSTANVVSGSITVPIGDLPTYVRLPSTANTGNLSVSSVGGGIGGSSPATNLATSATATSGSSAPNVSLVNDGIFQTGGYLATPSNNPDWVFQSQTLPDTVLLTWGGNQQISCVLIRQLPPWTDVGVSSGSGYPACAMLTGKLEYWDGSAYQPCPTMAKNHWDSAGNYNNTTAGTSTTFQCDLGHDTDYSYVTWFSLYDNNWVLNVPFTVAVNTMRIRLTVSTVSNGHLVAGTQTYNSVTKSVTISEMLAFNLSVAPPPPSSGESAGFMML